MPIVDPQGNGEYWFEGEMFDGEQKPTTPPDLTTGEYWFEGLLIDFLLSAATPPVNNARTQVIMM